MAATPTPAKPRGATARGKNREVLEELDACTVYARAVLVSAFGHEEGQRRAKKLPALVALMWWKDAWARAQSGPWH